MCAPTGGTYHIVTPRPRWCNRSASKLNGDDRRPNETPADASIAGSTSSIRRWIWWVFQNVTRIVSALNVRNASGTNRARISGGGRYAACSRLDLGFTRGDPPDHALDVMPAPDCG